MADVELLAKAPGADFVLGSQLDAWRGFDVVRFRAKEALSEPYEVDITLIRRAEAGPADLDALLESSASLRIKSETRWRVIHGLVAEAEELDRTRELYLYRIKLVPPIWRAKHRVRCRTFVDNTLEEIITAVLENRATVRGAAKGGLTRRSGAADPPPAQPEFQTYLEPSGAYRLAITDMARLRDRELRRYVVQYNETDFDFLSRLLEEEGLSYYFDQEASRVVMTVSDQPGFVPLLPRDERVRLQGQAQGAGPRDQEAVRQLRKVRRLRSQAVTLRDWDEIRPHRVLEASAEEDGADPEILGRCEFPGRDEGNVDTPDVRPTIVRLERSSMERQLAEGRGNVRILEPGLRFTLHDESGLREDEDLVITSVETFATQLIPEGLFLEHERFGLSEQRHVVGQYENRFEVLPASVVYRPAMTTPRPRVEGVHAAVVTAEEFLDADKPEIHCNEDGWVRLRFPWDQRKEAATASSCWVRASQGWAGAGFGAMYIPRVGQEVLVAYYQGDVERPVIAGRVYNTIQPVPYALPANKTVSTLKSQSSPGGNGFNELRFEDQKGDEEVFLHAEKNLNEVVKASHSNSVGGDQSYSVGGNQKFTVDGNQVNHVKGTRAVHVTGMQHMTQKGFTSNADQNHEFTSINAKFMLDAKLGVKAQDARFLLGHAMTILAPSFYCEGASAQFNESDAFFAAGGGAKVELSKGSIRISNGAGAVIKLIGGAISIDAPGGLVVNGSSVDVRAGAVSMKSEGQLDLLAKTIDMVAPSAINALSAAIKLNG